MIERIKVAEKIDFMDIKDVIRQIDEVLEAVPSFKTNKVFPYNFPMTVEEVIRPARDIHHYTRSSAQIIRAEVWGLIPIINHWIDYYNEDDVLVELLEGKHAGEFNLTKESTAKMMEEAGLVRRVEVKFNE